MFWDVRHERSEDIRIRIQPGLHGTDVWLCHLRMIVHSHEGKSCKFFAERCKSFFDIVSIEMPGAAADGTQERNQPRSNIARWADDQPDFVVHELHAADFVAQHGRK